MKIVIPENNSIRFVKRQYNAQPTGSVFTDEQAPFNRQYFNTLYRDEIKWNKDSKIKLFGQLYADWTNYVIQQIRDESITTQILSDTALTLNTNIKINAYDYAGNEIFPLTTPAVNLKINNSSYNVKFEYVKFIDIDGKVGFYFDTGTKKEYDVNSNEIETNDFYLNGALPEFLAVGQSYIFTVLGSVDPNTHSGTFQSIEYSDTYNAYIVKTNHTYSATTNSEGTLNMFYERTYDDGVAYRVYEIVLSGLSAMTCAYFQITTSTDAFTTVLERWETDYIYRNLDINDASMLFRWRGAKDKFLIDFRTGLINFAYIPVTMYELKPEGDVEIYNGETGNSLLLDSNYRRRFSLKFTGIPRHLVEKLALMIRHETFYINQKAFVYVGDGFGSEPLSETMLFNVQFEVNEAELLGIYSTGYINTKPDDEKFNLKIDTAGNDLLIDSTHKLKIS